MNEHVLVEVDDGVGSIAFNRPDKLNALAAQTVSELQKAFVQLEADDAVRAIVFYGRGRAFSAGLDLGEGLAVGEDDPVMANHRGMVEAAEITWTIHRCRKPVVVPVQGHAVGAGLAFASAATVRFVGPKAVLGAPFLKLGVTVGDLGLSWFLPRLIGVNRANRLLFSAAMMSAEEAVAAGFADEISEDPIADAFDFARTVAQFQPFAVEESKRLLNAAASTPLREHLEAELRAQTIGLSTEHSKQAIAAALGGAKKTSGKS